MEIGKEEAVEISPPSLGHSRKLTLADFAPSPMAHRLRRFVLNCYNLLEPYLRPVIRTYVVACLRLFIRWLPHIVEGLTFDLQSTSLTFPELPGTQISAGQLSIHAKLSFTQLGTVIDTLNQHQTPRPLQARRLYGMTAWRKRLMASFQRSLDRAWGKAQGHAAVTLKLHNVAGSTRQLSALTDGKDLQFLRLPGAIDFEASMGFNPREGTVDTHSLVTSLAIGHCFVQLDALKLLLSNLKQLYVSQAEPEIDTFDITAVTSPEPPMSALLTPTTPRSEFFLSPISDSSQMSTSLSSDTRSPILHASPASPLLQVLSASIRSRRRYIHRPCFKLKDVKDTSIISSLRSARITLSTITFSAEPVWGVGSYQSIIQDIELSCNVRDDPTLSPLQQQWFGKTKKVDIHDPDIYGLKFSIQQLAVERRTKLDSLQVLTMGIIDVEALATQWPAPWLATSSFLCGDPNAPLLVVRANITGIDTIERVECLRHLAACISSAPKSVANRRKDPRTFHSLPRVSFELHCGTVRTRIICEEGKESSPLFMELRSNGLIASATSSFRTDPTPRQDFVSNAGLYRLLMDYKLSISLEPTLVRVRSMVVIRNNLFTDLRSSDADFLNDPPLFSMESLEVYGEGHAIASITHDSASVALVSSSSPTLDLHVSTDALCLELWHPNVVKGTHRLLSIIPGPSDKPALSHSLPILDRLPTGLSATLALVRFVVFTTAPDINPSEIMGLSRGFAIRTGFSISYSSMHASHADRFHDLPKRTQTRHKLYLPLEQIVDAVAAARASVLTNDATAYIKICFSDISLRSAVATQYDADDPLIAERDDPALKHQEFLRIANVGINLCLSRKRSSVPYQTGDGCEISVDIPYIRATFSLAHMYCMLLAFQTLRSFLPVSPANTPRQPLSLAYNFRAVIPTFQILLALPKQNFAVRIDGINVHMSKDKSPKIQLNNTLVWVCLPSQINRWNEDTGEKWEEFLSLHKWNISFFPSVGVLSILADGDGARLRIPFGFILADLIFDAIVTVKALRHLFQITAVGCYMTIPNPAPEGPKSMPNLTIRVGRLCLEASDDPFESKLAVIWRCGLEAVKQRMEREKAFSAKVAAIRAAETEFLDPAYSTGEQEYQFGGKHSISIEEARHRLDEVHSLDWTLRLQNLREKCSKSEDIITQRLRSPHTAKGASLIPNIVEVSVTEDNPPLFRALLNGLSLIAQPPSFPIERLPDFLFEQGSGLPRDTQFSLLVPMHIRFSLSSVHVTLRDYPLPFFSIPPHKDNSLAAWEFETDLVVGEEMGTDLSVDWINCPIVGSHYGVRDASPMSILVPKTIMPVKTYANPVVRVTTDAPTILSWSVSYTAAIHDLMRVIETLSSSPRDSSPVVGFWDKIRLVFHWSLEASFKGEVRFHMKGTRDPHQVSGLGAGFVLSWQGNTMLLIGRQNENRELIQVVSDSMSIAIPNLEHLAPHNRRSSHAFQIPESSKPFQKICAKLRSGVRFGIGFVLERSCGEECVKCSGTAFQRQCRHFDFRPHYKVKLEKKPRIPLVKGPEDSYNFFRSDFIHLSISLASSTRTVAHSKHHHHNSSSLHLTPKAFAHFWSWCALFDGLLSLPIRQGTYYPPRLISPKFGRHLATVKYRVYIRRLFISHAYIDESRETWADGVIPWIGVKAMIDEFQVDMHQREEETTAPGLLPDTMKVTHHKPFYAAEVILKGLDMRAMLATFDEDLRQAVQMAASPHRSNYSAHKNLPTIDLSSAWHDADDFVETDWSPSDNPSLHLLPVATCPHFTYFKRNSAIQGNTAESSKFGVEKSHNCLLGEEPSIPEVQVSLVSTRIREIKRTIRQKAARNKDPSSLQKMMSLLEDYVTFLRAEPRSEETSKEATQSYLMPSHTVSPAEWAEFENVYTIHCPKIYMDSAIRDIMIQYYYCSRARKGLEYHLATRAVKFIRDQANAALAMEDQNIDDTEKVRDPGSAAQLAASALRKMLKMDYSKSSVEISTEEHREVIDPLNGWSNGVSLRKSHCCLLLKPQIVMCGQEPKDTCVVAAVQAKLQSFAIMDNSNAGDPVSGKVMSRSYTSVSGLQSFSPVSPEISGDGSVPLEVLIDLRCESSDFDRLVPQTDATIHYDKFNRLRLRNNVTSAVRPSTGKSDSRDHHLQDQTDLIRVHIPRFTVSASDEQFQAISHIVTQLLLFSDPAHKTRLDKLETLLFTYDFTDLSSAANVVSSLQNRLKDAMEAQQIAENIHSRRLQEEEGRVELLKLKAHIFLLTEDLNLLFDAIKLAQDRLDDHTDHKSALLLHTSSSEISWHMLDDRRDLLSKLVVQNIDFNWLSRQDSSTGNNLTVRNMQAFDGSRHALWAEILSKYDEPPSHPLVKKGLFILASWTILPPVGGITIYESFELSLHPMRLQIDARLGSRIMEYLWPARRQRHIAADHVGNEDLENVLEIPPKSPFRTSLDSPRGLYASTDDAYARKGELMLPLRRLGTSRSFTDLKTTRDALPSPALHRIHSSDTLHAALNVGDGRTKHRGRLHKNTGDAAEMKTRASQKSFVLVRISSLSLLLSIVKEGSFECHDARIRTRDLEYRNQTWSFEELVNQFIPSNMSWRGWIKMAFHQPLLPVFPVARELISKTKWIASSSKAPAQIDLKGPPPKLPRAKVLSVGDDTKLDSVQSKTVRARSQSPQQGWRKGSRGKLEAGTLPKFTTLPLTDEPDSLASDDLERPNNRKRLRSLFSRAQPKLSDSMSIL